MNEKVGRTGTVFGLLVGICNHAPTHPGAVALALILPSGAVLRAF